MEDDKPVRLGSRAFDILIALADRAGELVSKDELIARAWPNTFVEEGNLKFQVRALRRALGDGQAGRRYISNVPGRGYSLIAPVSRAEAQPAATSGTASTSPHNLPAQLTRLIGRTNIIERLVRQVPSQRLTTIVGPGGIGKTTLALSVAEELLVCFPHGVWLVELAPIADPALVPAALASILRVDASPDALVRALNDKQILILMDNCEHVIEAVARLAATLLAKTRALHIIATSREPLRVVGERVHRLAALQSPPTSTSLDAKQALEFPAVELFAQCAAADVSDFELSDEDAASAAEICRKLDGVPLALELAAARVEAFGVRGLAQQLEHGLVLQMRRRATHARHRAITATLEWSYQLLTNEEQAVFRRLAIFSGSFSTEAVKAIASTAELTPSGVIETLSNLVAKSLVVAATERSPVWFRLLETTRAYAREKLDECGEGAKLARRHAEHYRELLEHVEADLDARSLTDWLPEYGHHIDNLRAALDWAFSSTGDAVVGVAMAVAAIPFWMHLSLVDECRARVEQALASLATSEPDACQEMKLLAALGASRLYTSGGMPEVALAWTKALQLAEVLGDGEYQKLSLWGLWSFNVNGVDYQTALSLAHRFVCLATTDRDRNDRSVGERMIGISHHNLGDQQSARRHIERALSGPAARGPVRHFIRLQLDPQVTARAHLARILWLQGFPNRAMRESENSVDDARAAEHAISFSYALHRAACPVTLWNGDLAAAGHYAEMLLDHGKRHALVHWQLYGRGFQGAVAIRRGDIATGLRLLRLCYNELGETGVTAPRFMRFAAVYMAEGLRKVGQIAEALDAIDDSIARAERTDELWHFAELLRAKGDVVLSLREAAAGDYFRQALDIARRQGALSWELRAATSLARLLKDRGRPNDAKELLQPIYDRFTEGFETADLKAAKSLLDGFISR